ncbi:MAG: DinB family protein [Candidatus Acidiferrales bacterium]
MTRDERRLMIESFGRGPALLGAALRPLPKKMWLYQPSSGRWSIHEIILHLADREVNSYFSFRRLIAEPHCEFAEFDAAQWAGSLGYFHQSTREAVEIIRRLRKMTYQLAVALPPAVWLRTVTHARQGEITLEEWLQEQERHIPAYIDQIRQNYVLWLETHPPRKNASRTLQLDVPSAVPSVSLSAQPC